MYYVAYQEENRQRDAQPGDDNQRFNQYRLKLSHDCLLSRFSSLFLLSG